MNKVGLKGSTITEDEDDGDGKGCAALQQPANVTAKQINVDDDKVRPFVRATDRAISKQTREAFNIGLEVCSMFFPLVAMVRVDLSNPTTLTPEEAVEIQSITDKYNTNIDVVVSRAASKGCNVATDLPVGKGSDKRSDIDFRYDASHPQAESIRTDLKGLGGGAGSASPRHSTTDRATKPPLSTSSQKDDNQLCHLPIYCVRLIGIGATDRCWMLDG